MWRPSAAAGVTNEQTHVWAYLAQLVSETPGELPGYLTETSAYALAVPGKLLRPLLLLDACRAAGGNPELVLPAAAGIEAAHMASLIHDDIVDGDDLRRGRPSLQARFDLPAALITGDLFIFTSFLGLIQSHDLGVSAERALKAIRLLSQMGIDMCKGQALEAALACRPDVTEAAYLHMVRLKTASVCSTTTQMGACLGGGSDMAVAVLGAYGQELGIAFQITDDILAYDGDPHSMGKPLHSDTRNCRITLPLILARQTSDADLRRRIDHLTESEASALDRHNELKAILDASGALDQARMSALQFTRRAQEHLNALSPSPALDRLHRLAGALVQRGS